MNNQNPLEFRRAMDNIVKEKDKALRRIFGNYIKGNFLIEMKHYIQRNYIDIYQYYDWDLSAEKFVAGNDNSIDFDLSRAIVGCHSSNVIFLEDSERISLEKDDKYKKELAEQVVQNVRLRRYGSQFFRQRPIMQGELFLAHNVPYNTFVMAIRISEILDMNLKQSDFVSLYSLISNKTLATLTLLEDNFLDNCYPICRATIELYLKLMLSKDYPNLIEEYYKFNSFEIDQSCCEQEYPEDFNELFKNRKNKSKPKKIDYLHYGWVDSIPDYHSIINGYPYSINGIFEFLKETHIDEENYVLSRLEILYKMCHGYTHGNVSSSRYPLLHYFEVSTILHLIVSHTYMQLCKDLEIDTNINGIDIIFKANKDFEVLDNQHHKKSTETFENHYKNKRN